MDIKQSASFACMNLRDFLPCSMVRISPFSASLNYAHAIFEGMSLVRVDGKMLLFHPRMNLERMRQGARAIGIPMDSFPDEKIIGNIFALAAINGFHKSAWHGTSILRAGRKINKFYVRQLLFVDSDNIGMGASMRPGLLSTISPIGEHLLPDKRRGIKVMLFPFPRKLQFPSIKTSSNYQLGIYARTKMMRFNAEHGECCREVIFQNSYGDIIGASGENAVMLRDGELVSPPLGGGAPPGSTLRMVSHLAKGMGIGFREGSITLKDIESADAFFLAGDPAGIVPVSGILEVDGNFRLKGMHGVLSAGNNTLRKLKGQYGRMEIGEGEFRRLHYDMQDWLSLKETERLYSCGLRFLDRMARAWKKGLENLSTHRPNPRILTPSGDSSSMGACPGFAEFCDSSGKGSGFDGNKERC
ncbi:MAG: aminotransferase class IV [Candidatus Micrarchaeota archaeon]